MKKIMGYILFTLVLGVTVVYSTYSWYTWSTTEEGKKNINLTIEGINENNISHHVSFVNQPELIPVSTKTKGYITNISISQTYKEELYATFNLTINKLDPGLKDHSFKYELTLGDTILGNGNFSAYEEGDTIALNTSPVIVTNKSQVVSLYIWIDGQMTNDDAMQNSNYQFDLVANMSDNKEA